MRAVQPAKRGKAECRQPQTRCRRLCRKPTVQSGIYRAKRQCGSRGEIRRRPVFFSPQRRKGKKRQAAVQHRTSGDQPFCNLRQILLCRSEHSGKAANPGLIRGVRFGKRPVAWRQEQQRRAQQRACQKAQQPGRPCFPFCAVP